MRPLGPPIAALLLLGVLAAGCARSPAASAPAGSGGDLLSGVSVEDFGAMLEAERGRPVLVNLWASWCPPCRDEAPALAAASRAYGHRVAFVGVNYRDRAGGARAFKDDFGLGFPSVADPRGEIARSLTMVGIPVTVIFDAEGAEAFRRVGALSESELVARLERVLRASRADA